MSDGLVRVSWRRYTMTFTCRTCGERIESPIVDADNWGAFSLPCTCGQAIEVEPSEQCIVVRYGATARS